MRRAVREQVQPAEPGDDHTSDATGYTGLPRSEDDRGQPRSVYRRPPRSGRPEAACRQGEEGIDAPCGAATRFPLGDGIGLLRVSISLLGVWRRVFVGGLLYSVHGRSR